MMIRLAVVLVAASSLAGCYPSLSPVHAPPTVFDGDGCGGDGCVAPTVPPAAGNGDGLNGDGLPVDPDPCGGDVCVAPVVDPCGGDGGAGDCPTP